MRRITLLIILCVGILIAIPSVFMLNHHSSISTVTENSSISKVFKIERNKLSINVNLLKKLNTSVYQRFVHNPLPCNQSWTYRGFIVPLKPTTQTTNKDCIRATRDYEIPKPNGTVRIVFLGDSFIYGLGVNDNETLPAILESDLNSKIKNKHFECINLGVPGYNTKLEVNRLVEKGLKYQPNIVVLTYVLNDYENARVVKNLDYYVIRGLLKRNISMENAWKIRLKFNYLKYFPFNSTFPDSVEKPFRRLYNLSREYNFSVIVISYPLFYYLDEKDYVAKLSGLCEKYGFPFYYLPKVIGYKEGGKWIQAKEDIHPTAYANNVTANFLARVIQKQYKLH